ncbi:MAG TPA: hypothetical protein VKA96_03335 [Solirubrobacteraceae bacterium]|nr:hypothetical protein [Solirubrobacteraceae bacterium]
MRFTDFLKATVMISAGSATALAAATVVAAGTELDYFLVAFAAVWWLAAGAIGLWLGRRRQTSAPIGRLLANARMSPALPEQQPGRILLNRLWPLLVLTVCAGALALVVPQVPAVAAGFAIIWALSWRRQEAAVSAVEGRDGVRFYIERTSPVKPIRLLRTPGFYSTFPSPDGSGKAEGALHGGL